jgi:hypothetical protein
MSVVSAAPDDLDAFVAAAHGAAQRHRDIGRRLDRALDAARAAGVARAALAEPGRDLQRFAVQVDDLAAFVDGTAGSFRAADRVLAHIGPSVTGPGTAGLVDGGAGGLTWHWHQDVQRRIVDGRVPLIGDRANPGRDIVLRRGDADPERVEGTTEITVATVAVGGQRGRAASAGVGGDHARAEATARAGDEWSAQASVGVHDGRLGVAGSARYAAGLSAQAMVSSRYGIANGHALARASVGASAEARAVMGIGRRGVHGELEADVLLGGEVEGEVSVGAGGVQATTSGGLSYGVGAELDADASVGLDKVGFHLDLGLTAGLGLQGGVDVAVNPREVASTVTGGAKAAGKRLKKLGKKLW